MNVLDHLKDKPVDLIKNYCVENAIPAAVAMMHINGDFNLGSLIRAANFFGFKEAIYVGGSRNWDRRSAVGTHNYTPTHHFKDEDQFIEYATKNYSLICVENNIPEYSYKTKSLFDEYVFDGLIYPPIFLFGEEQQGLDKKYLEACRTIITIPDYGSVRSMNVGCCASAVLAFYRKHYNEKCR